MNTQHTPGPWHVTEHSAGMICVAGPDHKDLCAVGYNKTEGRDDAANAQLIAAAPDMLKALEGCLRVAKAHYLDMVDQYTDDDPDIEEHLRHAHPNIAAAAMEVKRIETIIRKATGNI